jgi:hypothetical protein
MHKIVPFCLKVYHVSQGNEIVSMNEQYRSVPFEVLPQIIYVVELQTERNDTVHSYGQFTSLELQTEWNDTVHSYRQFISL